MIPPKTYRRSLLHGFETCPRRTLHALQMPDDLAVGWIEASSDLGTMLHLVFAEMLRTMCRYGHEQMPTQEAVEVMREVYAASDIVLPAAERDDLRWLVLQFCEYRFPPKRILCIEKQIEAEIRCPDGKLRTLTGIPDMLMRDGEAPGIVIPDWKSSKGKPRTPRGAKEGEPIKGRQYLSDRGHFQGDCYGLLVMRAFPRAEYTIFRELHLRSGEIREAVLGRDELEHIEYELGAQMQKLERAIEEGESSDAWKPRPGRHCAKACPVATSCPIPAEQRGIGALQTQETANTAAGRYVVVDGLRNQLREQLKTWFEQNGRAGEVGDGTGLYWRKNPETGKRDFGVWPLPTIEQED